MVLKSSSHSSSKRLTGTVIITLIVTILVTFGILFLFRKKPSETPQQPIEEDPIEEEIIDEKPVRIDFQPTIDSWVDSVSGNKSVIIYDLDLEEIAGEHNVTENYNTASLYKLFVVYEGYRRIEAGTWSTGDAVAGKTRLKCLDLAIRESYSPCAETLWNQIGHDSLDQIIENDFGITDSKISGLVSNVKDISSIMKMFYYHLDFNNEELVATMKDSFLNQPKTTYDWRRGLPSGFSSKVNVYNKVGWDWAGSYWRVYHDAAILEFPEENRHFIAVVMTNKIDYKDIARLGTAIETAFYEQYQ